LFRTSINYTKDGRRNHRTGNKIDPNKDGRIRKYLCPL
jgi:hypothetical protein